MPKPRKLTVQGTDIVLFRQNENDYISLTDIVKHTGDEATLYSWLRNRNTVEFLGAWEQIHNPDFKPVEFDRFKKEAGLNSFRLTPKKWVDATGAIGIISRAGRYGGGTLAHADIAFEFASWISPHFKLFLIKEFQRLKDEENTRLALGWDMKRTLAKIHYRTHADAVRDHLIPPDMSKWEMGKTYASEADLLNLALFGMTAADWRAKNPDAKCAENMRDSATAEQLVCLAGLESIHAELIREGLSPEERLTRLNRIARTQMQSLLSDPGVAKIRQAIEGKHR